MSTNNHAPIASGAAANTGILNAPLGQLDAAIGDLDALNTTEKSSSVAAINELKAGKQDVPSSQAANRVYASPDGTSGTPGFRALGMNDLPASGVSAGTYTKVTISSKGVVTAGGSVQASDIADLTSVAVDTLGATTDNTNNNASTAKHGFMPKLANDAMQVINGLGAWVKWAMGLKYNGSGAYTPRAYIDFRGAGVTVQDDSGNDAIRVTISGIAGGSQALSTLTDVSLASPMNNQVLAYNYSSGLWENINISSFVPTGHVIQNGGSNLTNRPSLNFGGGLTAVDNSGSNSTDVTANIATTTAENDFAVGGADGSVGTWVKKTLAETKTLLGIVAASLTVAGVVELATTAEIDAGEDSTRAMPVDQFAASNRNVRYAVIRVLEKATNWPANETTGVGGDFPMPFTGTLVSIKADVDVAGTTGTAIVDANLNGTTVMDTHKLKWDSTEKSTATYSGTAATLSTTTVTAGDIFTVDVDANHTTKSKGLTVTIGVRMA